MTKTVNRIGISYTVECSTSTVPYSSISLCECGYLNVMITELKQVTSVV